MSKKIKVYKQFDKYTGTYKYVFPPYDRLDFKVLIEPKEDYRKLTNKQLYKHIKNSQDDLSLFSYSTDLNLFLGVDSKNLVDKISYGSYILEVEKYSDKCILHEAPIRNDKVFPISPLATTIKNDIKTFLANEDIYKKYKCIYKKGILMYGDPGSGKTSLIRSIINSKVAKNAYTIFLNEIPKPHQLVNIEAFFKDELKIIIIEELLDVYAKEQNALLTFLDGEQSLSKCLILATTNYPAKLPDNLINREARFDKVYHVDTPCPSEINEIFKILLERDADKEELSLTKGFTFAAIREVILYSKLNNISIKKSLELTLNHKNKVKNAFVKLKKIGIIRDDDKEI